MSTNQHPPDPEYPSTTDAAALRQGDPEISRQELVFENFGARTRLSADLGASPGDDIAPIIDGAMTPDTLFVIDEPGRYDLGGPITPLIDAWGLVVEPGVYATLSVPGGVDAALGDPDTPLRKGLFGGFELAGRDAGGHGRLDIAVAPGGHVDVLDVQWAGAADAGDTPHPVRVAAQVGGTLRCERVRATGGGTGDGVHIRSETSGSVDLIDSSVIGFDGDGVASNGNEGAVHVVGGEYADSAGDQLRFGGPHTWAIRAAIRAESSSTGSGVRWTANNDHRDGGLIRDSELDVHGGSPSIGGDEGTGPLRVENCILRSDSGGGIRAQRPNTDQPSRWEIVETDIVGGDSNHAVNVDEREGSLIESCVIHLPNGDGVVFDDADPGDIVESRVDVGRTAWRHADVDACTTTGGHEPRSVL